MLTISRFVRPLPALLLCLLPFGAGAQSFHVQCPLMTPNPVGPISAPSNPVTIPGGQTKCQQISGGDGFATMGDGTQTYLFAFGPLSGMADIVKGLPGTQTAAVFNSLANNSQAVVGAPQAGDTFNGAVGLVPDPEPLLNSSNQPICPNGNGGVPGTCLTGHVDPRLIMDVGVLNGSQPAPLFAIDEDDEFFLTLTNVGQVMRPDLFEQHTVHFHGYPNASRSTTVCRTLRSPSTSAAASPITTWRRMPAPTSGTATSRRQSTCRWAWSARSTFGHGRTV
jgi:hypothetical protein